LQLKLQLALEFGNNRTVVHCTWVVFSQHELEFIKIKLALFWPTVYFTERLMCTELYQPL